MNFDDYTFNITGMLRAMAQMAKHVMKDTEMGKFIQLCLDNSDAGIYIRSDDTQQTVKDTETELWEIIIRKNPLVSSMFKKFLYDTMFILVVGDETKKNEEPYFAPFFFSKMWIFTFLIYFFPIDNEINAYWVANMNKIEYKRDMCYFMGLLFDDSLKDMIMPAELTAIKRICDNIYAEYQKRRLNKKLAVDQEARYRTKKGVLSKHRIVSILRNSLDVKKNLTSKRSKSLRGDRLQLYRRVTEARLYDAAKEHSDDDDSDEETTGHVKDEDDDDDDPPRIAPAVVDKHTQLLYDKDNECLKTLAKDSANIHNQDDAYARMIEEELEYITGFNGFVAICDNLLPLIRCPLYPPELARKGGVDIRKLHVLILLIPYLLSSKNQLLYKILVKYERVTQVYPIIDPTTFFGLCMCMRFFTETHLDMLYTDIIHCVMQDSNIKMFYK